MTEDTLDRVSAAARRLKAYEEVTRIARQALYAAVSDASADGHPTMTIASSAGWRTKKAVYDAIRAARSSA